MATNSSFSQKVLKCRGRACAKCGYCRDWYWSPQGKTKSYTKRLDANCTASYCYGRSGYGPGCGGCCLCILARFWCVNCCVHQYYGGDGYGHGAGLPLDGYLTGGINHHIEKLAGVDFDARHNRNVNAGVADIFLGGAASFASGIADLSDGTLKARIALARTHHDDGRLCECNENQQ
ncbi:unnamed protein product [Rotaria socialis]|uniref:Uncharacterized protein n=1 Tax=Rotaria socialis TaxID=392032 RepID=A0A821DXK8_9BILA|nr:unnamed protein product [Rotaria socialis]CAF3352285.1 unnamed protein product [Rotaria socialis]CAF4263797.1 unnamed protein product [Rotaria socialis]CAF4627960.1 unnamed protein product [Rotaria socialis]